MDLAQIEHCLGRQTFPSQSQEICSRVSGHKTDSNLIISDVECCEMMLAEIWRVVKHKQCFFRGRRLREAKIKDILFKMITEG